MGDELAKHSPNFIDLVVLKNRLYVFQAPAFSGLKEGDEVVIKSDKEEVATVERVYTARKSGAELDFILTASGTILPLRKILKKLDYKEFEYEDEGRAYEEIGLDSKA